LTHTDQFALFAVTAPGENDIEFICIARDEADAIGQYHDEANPDDDEEWVAHTMTPMNSHAWCEGYLEAFHDIRAEDDDE